MTPRLMLIMMCVVAAATIGGLAWVIITSTSPAPTIQAPAEAVRQADQSLVLERAPVASPQPAHQIPAKSKVQRTAKISIKPEQPHCDPLDLDLSLVEMHNRATRIIASSPTAQITGGIDHPAPAEPPPPVHRWGAGVTVDINGRLAGAWVERDLWRVRAGLDVDQRADGSITPRVRVGITF